MFSGFIKSFVSYPESSALPIKTRFDQSEDLKKIAAQLMLLETQKQVLETAAKINGAGSVDFKKLTIVHDLLTKINDEIRKFNYAEWPNHDRITEVKKMVCLLKNMLLHILDVLEYDRVNLNEARNDNKTWVKLGIFLAGPAALVMTSGLSLLAIGGGMAASSYVNFTYDKHDQCAYTLTLIIDLAHYVEEAHNNLAEYYNRNRKREMMRCVIGERTWGAIALCVHPIFRFLPEEIKSLILSQVTYSYMEKDANLNLTQYNYSIFKATNKMLQESGRLAQYLEAAKKPEENTEDKDSLQNNNTP